MQLPFEIWFHIAGFVHPAQLRNLYTVNRAFFHAAMDERYREVNSHLYDGLLYLNYERLKDQSIARRTRIISVSGDLAAWRPTRLPDLKDRNYSSLLQIMGNMANVEEFILVADEIPLERPNILSTAWQTFGLNLRRLYLGISLEIWKIAMPQDLVFPALEKLRIRITHDIHNNHDSYSTDTMRDVVAAFVNRHHATINSLALYGHVDDNNGHGYDSYIDSSVLLRSIRRLPCLRKLTVSYPKCDMPYQFEPFEDNIPGLRDFLEIHSAELCQLTIGFRRPHSLYRTERLWYPSVLLDVTLPRLESLDFNAVYEMDLPLIISILDQHKRTLTALTLRERDLELPFMRGLLNAIGGPSSPLQALHINMAIWSYLNFFDLMVNVLPNLIHLTIRCLVMTDLNLDPDNDSVQPAPDSRMYGNWGVRHLTIVCSFPPPSQDTSRFTAEIFGLIPSLRTLDVKSATEYERDVARRW